VTLHYVADPGEANDVFFHFSPGTSGNIEIKDSGATITAGSGCSSVSPTRVTCQASSGTLIDASLGDGNDILSISRFLDAGGGRLSGGDGDDRIRGNDYSETYEILLGGRGADSLFGRGGIDLLKGGPGADDLSGGTSCEALTAGICEVEVDTVSYVGRTKRVHATADGLAGDDGHRFEGDTIMADVERIVGGRGNDTLGGTTTNIRFADLIPHLVGMLLVGRGGDDVLKGTRGPDTLAGGRGDDDLRAAGGRDILKGSEGDDRLLGGEGSDRLLGGRGHDRLLARDGQFDRVYGGRGTDEGRVDAGLDRVRRVERLL
jgi:Ca2+-binding RTX toxin-like protein